MKYKPQRLWRAEKKIIRNLIFLCASVPLWLIFISYPLFAVETGSATGLVRDKVTQVPISGARIMIDGKRKATTDKDGRFLIEVSPSSYNLSVKTQGYGEESKKIEVFSEKTLEINFELVASLTFYGEEFVIEAPEPTPTEEVTISKEKIEPSEIKDTSVNLFNDLSGTLKCLPGVIISGDFSVALYVRGGSPLETIYVLDRVFVKWPYRWGGMLTMFNTRLIDEVDFYAGGFPAEAGNSLAGVIDIRYKKGSLNKRSGLFELSPTTSELLLEGPIKKEASSYLFSAKRTHYDYLAKFFVKDKKDNVFPWFDDGLMKLYFCLSPKHKITTSLLYAGEGMDMQIEEEDSPNAAGGHFGYSYKKGIFGIDHKWIPNEEYCLQTTLSHSIEKGDFNFYHPEMLFEQKMEPKDIDLRADLDCKINPKHTLRGGTYLSHNNLKFIGRFEWDEITGTPTRIRKKESYDFVKKANYSGLYIWDRYKPIEKLNIDIGLRYEYLDLAKDSCLLPRFSLKYDLGDMTSVKLAYCLNSQFPMNIYELDDKEGNPDLTPEKGIDHIIGLERKIAPDLKLKMEGYYKKLDKLILSDNEKNFLNKGKGKAYGFEMFLQKKEGKKLDGWISYAYSISKRTRGDNEYTFENGTETFGVSDDPKFYFTEQDRRHTLSIVGNYRLSKKWRLSATWRLNTGNPYTPLKGAVQFGTGTNDYKPIWGDYNSARMPSYQTLDLKFEKQFKIKGLDALTYIQFLNTYNHKNIYEYYYSDDYKKTKESKMLPFMFLGGFEMRF